MVHPIKRQKVEETTSYKEEVLFNSDALSKIISYLTSIDLLNLALTCKRFGVYDTDTIQRFIISDDDNELSLIEKSARITIKDIATEEELAALPYYEGENSLEDYHYLQFTRGPLTFDQLVGVRYVNKEDKTCVTGIDSEWATAFSNNIMRAGKHYATFPTNKIVGMRLMVGAMRPGKASVNARSHPHHSSFYQNFSPNIGRGECNNNNNIHSCLFYSYNGHCFSSDWRGSEESRVGMEGIPFDDEIGLLLNLDDGTLSVYKNGRKLGRWRRD